MTAALARRTLVRFPNGGVAERGYWGAYHVWIVGRALQPRGRHLPANIARGNSPNPAAAV